MDKIRSCTYSKYCNILHSSPTWWVKNDINSETLRWMQCTNERRMLRVLLTSDKYTLVSTPSTVTYCIPNQQNELSSSTININHRIQSHECIYIIYPSDFPPVIFPLKSIKSYDLWNRIDSKHLKDSSHDTISSMPPTPKHCNYNIKQLKYCNKQVMVNILLFW